MKENQLIQDNTDEVTERDKQDLSLLLEDKIDMETATMILCRAVHDMSYDQIADKLGCSKNKVKLRLMRPECGEALTMLNRQLLVQSATKARLKLESLMSTSRSDKVKLEAAIYILDNTGVGAGQGNSLKVTGNNVQVNISI